jgi:hypothetical protein
MAFKDSFHEIVPGYRINGSAVVFATKGVKTGGLGSGAKCIELGNIGVASRSFIETDDPDSWPVSTSFIPVPDIDALYEQLELAGLSTVVDGVLANPSNIALLDYTDDKMCADAVGDGGQFIFMRSNVTSFERKGNTWKVPDAEFDSFKERALARLSTVIDVAGQAANAYIHLDGSNDYVEFSGTATGLLDWDADWTVGINLVEFEVKSDGKFITLFSSGDNAIMLRRGGSNHGLYITGNNGQTKIGANTWHAPNPGGKLLFSYDGTGSRRLKYYIGNIDGSYSLRASYLVNTTNIGGNNPGTSFCIGKRVTSNNVAESLNYYGGLNNFICADEGFGGPIVTEYFGVNNTYDEASFYADLNSWVKMGEDTYPNVVDTLGALTGGELKNGTEEDFVEIPE